jgi:hypothetical protein
MIGLPHGIGMSGLPPVEQIILLTICSSSLVGQSEKRRIKLLDDARHTIITGNIPSPILGNGADLTMNGGNGAWRGL